MTPSMLRYRFLGGDGAVELEATAPLDADVAAAATTTSTAFIASPSREGRYRVRFDLVQRAGDRLLPLPVDAVERDIRVRPASRNPERWELRGDG